MWCTVKARRRKEKERRGKEEGGLFVMTVDSVSSPALPADALRLKVSVVHSGDGSDLNGDQIEATVSGREKGRRWWGRDERSTALWRCTGRVAPDPLGGWAARGAEQRGEAAGRTHVQAKMAKRETKGREEGGTGDKGRRRRGWLRRWPERGEPQARDGM